MKKLRVKFGRLVYLVDYVPEYFGGYWEPPCEPEVNIMAAKFYGLPVPQFILDHVWPSLEDNDAFYYACDDVYYHTYEQPYDILEEEGI